MISVFTVMSVPAEQRYRLIDRSLAHRLWPHEAIFGAAFAEAAARAYAGAEPDAAALRFVEYTFINLITRPGDLVALCRHLPAELQKIIVERYVRHPHACPEVVVAMGASDEVHRELPRDLCREVPTHLYASARLNAEPGRRFDLHELFPYGTDADPVAARAVLGSALDAGRLTDQAKAAFLGEDGGRVPPPAFGLGRRVQVVLNDRNRTPRRGIVRDMLWHYADRRWYFFLRDDSGRRIRKRYRDDDLRPWD